MRLLNRSLHSGLAVFGLTILIVVLKIVYPSSSQLSFESGKSVVDELVRDSMLSVNDSLPHYRYRQIEDSVRRKYQVDNWNTTWTGDGFSIGHFGPAVLKGPDVQSSEKKQEYFFNVPGYFPTDLVSFYSKDGKNYLKYHVWTEVDKASGTSVGDPVTAETRLRYVPGEEKTWTIGFPISASTYRVLQIITIIIAGVLVVLGLFIFLRVALRGLLLIAKGQAFSDEVIGSLYTTAWFLIGTSLFFALARLALHLALQSMVSFPFTFYSYDDVMSTSNWLVCGLVVLLLAQAFRNGAILQKEQELTI